ncbi:hypothetical protein E6W39_00945 [Kitasatospora acidiphila]|uniref:Uncharacterized protein n=1 Tax=Kitasatospora acidiphila TaxID=2567942 RepID=A0A540WFY4_9ACTN|nr:hypothetical protein [Kitasatospora acidiphila]TQF07936.1 hypothetical protein E6W39_00945 [Kitasatospora acidiphila]
MPGRPAASATAEEHVLHQFPYTEHLLSRDAQGRASVELRWQAPLAPQPGGELVPPIQAAVEFSFTPLQLNHPDPFAATAAYMESEGYSVRLTEAFAHRPARTVSQRVRRAGSGPAIHGVDRPRDDISLLAAAVFPTTTPKPASWRA